MSVAGGKLITQANACIVAGGQTALANAQLAGIQESLCGVYCVANAASLPTACDNAGRLIWVTDIGDYRFSNGVCWSNDWSTTCRYSSGGCVLLAGGGTGGVLGNNNATGQTNRSSPVLEITSSTTWCNVFSAANHVSAIKTDGSIWSWGFNSCGALGDNSVTNRSSPVQEITSSSNWIGVSAGSVHTLAIKSDGGLWSWGYGSLGRLGDNTVVNKSSPIREISSSTTWCQTSAGSQHSTAIKNDGGLWAWGSNSGVLGDNTASSRSSPVREISSASTWGLTSGGNVTTAAIKTDGGLWVWGLGTCGRLGDGTVVTKSSPVREVTSSTWWALCAGNSTVALKNDNSLWSWGPACCGQLANNSLTDRSSPVQEITSSTNWCQVTTSIGSSGAHAGAIKTDGSFWVWGNNAQGALGDNTVVDRSSPVREITSSNLWCTVTASNAIMGGILGNTRGFNSI